MIDERNQTGRATDRGFGWGLPLGIAAVALVAGLLLFNSGDRTNTAANDRAPITQNVPAQTPAPIPAPTNVPVR